MNYSFRGGSLKSEELRDLLHESYRYNPKTDAAKEVSGFRIDPELSTRRGQVYVNPETQQVVVAHRGTQGIHDWITDLSMALGQTSGARFQHASKLQHLAEAKYGADRITTIGHSLGARLAEEYGGKTHEIIGVNGPTLLQDYGKAQRSNQYNVRTERDVVSGLAPYRIDRPGDRNVTVPSRSNSIFVEHSADTLGRRPGLVIGRPKGK
jgi:pimeloyl-ACP methyl ester carboxylesterase